MKAVLGAAVAALVLGLGLGWVGHTVLYDDVDESPVLLLGDTPRNWTYEGVDVYVVHIRRGLNELTPAFHPDPWVEGMYPRLVAPAPLACYVDLGPAKALGAGGMSELGFRVPVTGLSRPVVVGLKVEWTSEPHTDVHLVGEQDC